MSTFADRRPVVDRFWEKVDLSDPGGCWPWAGSLRSYGYGQFSISHSVNAFAHRVAYEILVGPIPAGLTLDHLCRNRRCVNPAHLEPVTMRENILRGTSFSAQAARRTHCPFGHPYDGVVVETFAAHAQRICTRCKAAATRRYRAKNRVRLNAVALQRYHASKSKT